MDKPGMIPFDKALMEAIKDMVFIVSIGDDSVYRYEFFNQAVFEKTHLTPNDKGKTFQEVHDQQMASFLEQQYSQVLATKEKVIYKDSYASPSGEPYYSEGVLTPMFDGSGNCLYVIGVIKDITTERLAKLESEAAWSRLTESRSRYRSLYENSADAIFSLDLNGEILTGNEAVEQMTGYPIAELSGTKFGQHITQRDAELVKAYFQLALDGVSNDLQTKFLGGSGLQIGVLINFAPVEVNGEIVGVYAVVKDMRELDELVRHYIESEKRFRIIAENSQDVIVLMDHAGETLYVSPSSRRVYGFDPTEYMEKKGFHNVYPADVPKLRKAFSLSIQKTEPYLVEVRIKNSSGRWVCTEVKGTPVFDENHQFIHMLMIARDVTLQKERETQLRDYAYHDSLTGLPNRRFLTDSLLEKINQAQTAEDVLAVILLDIDYFKEINDQFGHEAGDAVIEEFGRRLSKLIGEQDLAARLGGDEFVLLLSEIKTQEQAENKVKQIQQALKYVWAIEKETMDVTASIGIALVPLVGATVSSILKQADSAMYESKKAGRSTYRIYST